MEEKIPGFKNIKPLIVYKKKPLLIHHYDRLNFFCKKFYVNIHQNKNSFLNVIKKYNSRINIIIEKKLLGTAGIIISNLNLFSKNILIIYGDNYVNMNIKKFLSYFFKNRQDLLLAVYKKKDLSKSGLVKINKSNRVIGFEEKNVENKYKTGLCNAGVIICKKKIFKDLTKNKFYDLSNDILPKIIKKYNCKTYLIKSCTAFDDKELYNKSIKN